jgi:hypothetical protein
MPFTLRVQGSRHGQGRMDVPDIEATTVLPGLGEKVYSCCKKASSELEAATHHMSV